MTPLAVEREKQSKNEDTRQNGGMFVSSLALPGTRSGFEPAAPYKGKSAGRAACTAALQPISFPAASLRVVVGSQSASLNSVAGVNKKPICVGGF